VPYLKKDSLEIDGDVESECTHLNIVMTNTLSLSSDKSSKSRQEHHSQGFRAADVGAEIPCHDVFLPALASHIIRAEEKEKEKHHWMCAYFGHELRGMRGARRGFLGSH